MLHSLRFLGLGFFLVSCVASRAPGPDLEPRLAELEDENANLLKQVRDLENQLDVLEKRLLVVTTRNPIQCVSQPPIDALVACIGTGPARVTFDKGRQDGVKAGFVFDVYLRSEYKGQVRIDRVQEATSSGLVLHQKRDMAVGDSATTSL